MNDRTMNDRSMNDLAMNNPMLKPRYTGVPTFMRAPLVEDPARLDIAMIGLPYDGAVTNRAGARHGPREIRNMSSFMRTTHHVTKINPFELCRIGDMGDVDLPNLFDIEATAADIADYYRRVHAAGAVPLTAGGDHFITYPIVQAIAAERPLGDGPSYISFDVDGLDPVYAPGTGTPEIGGLTTIEAQALIRGMRGLDLHGGDVVEVAPPFDPSGNTALVGATMMYEILCVLAESTAKRKA